jgi:hypothetical protein
MMMMFFDHHHLSVFSLFFSADKEAKPEVIGRGLAA